MIRRISRTELDPVFYGSDDKDSCMWSVLLMDVAINETFNGMPRRVSERWRASYVDRWVAGADPVLEILKLTNPGHELEKIKALEVKETVLFAMKAVSKFGNTNPLIKDLSVTARDQGLEYAKDLEFLNGELETATGYATANAAVESILPRE